jgi:hypothetical protein
MDGASSTNGGEEEHVLVIGGIPKGRRLLERERDLGRG